MLYSLISSNGITLRNSNSSALMSSKRKPFSIKVSLQSFKKRRRLKQ
jgi:hypothetical protein